MLYIWLVIIIFSAVIEIATINLVSIWFSIGGGIALLADTLGFSQEIQIAVFVIVSLIFIVAARPLAKKYLKTATIKTNYDRIIGKHGLVTKPIDADTRGEVKVMSTTWLATGIDNIPLDIGDYCEILAVEGVHLVVKKIDK